MLASHLIPFFERGASNQKVTIIRTLGRSSSFVRSVRIARRGFQKENHNDAAWRVGRVV